MHDHATTVRTWCHGEGEHGRQWRWPMPSRSRSRAQHHECARRGGPTRYA
jgi:hypothetical protein